MAKGDHIYVKLAVRGIPYHHHGIDSGDGHVIHLAPKDGAAIALRDDSERFTVRKDTLADFAKGQEVHRVQHADGTRNADEVVATAESQIGRVGYSLLDGNCEHFASGCVTGTPASRQVEMGEATVSAVASFATKAAWAFSRGACSRLLLRGAAKVHPLALAADGVEVAVLALTCRNGFTPERSRKWARVSGSVAAAGVGVLVGGPAGAAVGLAAHSSSTAIAEHLTAAVRKRLG